jgi:hypothetical protein
MTLMARTDSSSTKKATRKATAAKAASKKASAKTASSKMASPKKGGDRKTPAERITERIQELGDWRGEALARIREIVKQADPDVVEEWKYRGVPVWYHDGIVCTGETYKNHVKMTFAKGASLKDPSGLFNATLGGDTWRAIDIHEGDKINERALKALIREAVEMNESD